MPPCCIQMPASVSQLHRNLTNDPCHLLSQMDRHMDDFHNDRSISWGIIFVLECKNIYKEACVPHLWLTLGDPPCSSPPCPAWGKRKNIKGEKRWCVALSAPTRQYLLMNKMISILISSVWARGGAENSVENMNPMEPVPNMTKEQCRTFWITRLSQVGIGLSLFQFLPRWSEIGSSPWSAWSASSLTGLWVWQCPTWRIFLRAVSRNAPHLREDWAVRKLQRQFFVLPCQIINV